MFTRSARGRTACATTVPQESRSAGAPPAVIQANPTWARLSLCPQPILSIDQPPMLQLKPEPFAAGSTLEAPAGVHQTLGSSGQPLDAHTRTHFEARLGHDFSAVRVHTDSGAAASAASIGATAYTAGAHIAFAVGRYQPGTSGGQRLLAHELVHVVQQSTAGRPGASSRTPIVRRQYDNSVPFGRGYQDGLKGDAPHPGPLSVDGLAAYDRGYAKGRGERMEGGTSGPVPGQASASPDAGAACKTPFTKASSFQDLINLVRAAEAALAAGGIASPKDQIHAIRGIFYGTLWSLDYSDQKSTTRNEGFQRFTRPSENVATSVPPDVRTALRCGLFDALQKSQDTVDPSGRHVDFGHLIIGLDAREDPALGSNIKYPVPLPIGSYDVDLGGTGTELVTWVGDLGGAAASLATRRATKPTPSAEVFSGSDYGGSINLEGDVAGSAAATSSATAVTAPNIAAGKHLSDVLQDYLSPTAPSAAWTTRARTFLTINGGKVDAVTGALTNRAALIGKFAPKLQQFACNYLASRVKDKHITFAQAKAAADHVIPCAVEVATVFVDALEDSSKTGGKIQALRFPPALPSSPGACTTQIYAGGAASGLGL